MHHFEVRLERISRLNYVLVNGGSEAGGVNESLDQLSPKNI